MKVSRRELLLFALLTALQAFAPRPGQTEPGPGAAGVVFLLTVAQGAALVLWRDRPGRMLAAVTGAYVSATLLDPVMPPLLLLAALVEQARRRPFRAGLLSGAAAVGAMAVAGVVAIAWRGGPTPDLIATYVLLATVALLAGLVLAARTAEREALRRRSAAEERLRIAHDLHDVVGHGLASIAVQSSTAPMALAAGRETGALTALAAAESASRQALTETRELVSLLSVDGEPGLSSLDQLIASVSGRALQVDLLVTGDPQKASATAGRAAYRVVQESLTNVVRHSGARRAAVQVDVSEGQIRVSVRDEGKDGTGLDAAAGAGSGSGLTGMRRRVEVLGGTVEAGPRADCAGWQVRAVLPNSVAGQARTAERAPRGAT